MIIDIQTIDVAFSLLAYVNTITMLLLDTAPFKGMIINRGVLSYVNQSDGHLYRFVDNHRQRTNYTINTGVRTEAVSFLCGGSGKTMALYVVFNISNITYIVLSRLKRLNIS